MPGAGRIIKNLIKRIFKKRDMEKLADETIAFSKTPEGKKQTLEFRQRFKGVDFTDPEAIANRQQEWLKHNKNIDKLTGKKHGGAVGPNGIL
tara:strand:- start:179 stop:454 length:276 start_codon:yes stop_codon:yes gene_type:complete